MSFRMVRLATARSPMEAKLMAARLGAEGIVWELRGSVDGPLAMGPIEVLVDEGSLPDAQELLLSDEVEASFAPQARPAAHTAREALVLIGVFLAVLLFIVARTGARF